MNSRTLFWACLLFSSLVLVSAAQTDKGAVAGGNAGTEFKQEVAKAVSKGSTQDSRKDTVSLADIDKWQEDDSSGAAVDKKSDKPTTTKSTSKKASSSTTATAVPTEQVTEAGGAAAATGTTEVVADTTAKPTEQAVLPSSNAAITPAGEAKPVTGAVSTMTSLSTVVQPSPSPAANLAAAAGGTIP